MTILEIEAKKTTLEGELSTALEAAKVLTPATVEFDEAYGRYLAAKTALARIPDEVAKAKQVENADGYATGAQPQHHIAKLADGGVSQHPFNISHYQAHTGGEDGGKAADDSHGSQCLNRVLKKR
ncbi:hypothetical protein LCGC14_2550710, partial [marine sediment metagenome]